MSPANHNIFMEPLHNYPNTTMPLKKVTSEDAKIINEITSNSTYRDKNVRWKQMAACIKHIKNENNNTIFLTHNTLSPPLSHTHTHLSLHILSTPKHLFVSLQAHYTHKTIKSDKTSPMLASSRSTWYYSTVYVIKKRKHIVCTSNKIITKGTTTKPTYDCNI